MRSRSRKCSDWSGSGTDASSTWMRATMASGSPPESRFSWSRARLGLRNSISSIMRGMGHHNPATGQIDTKPRVIIASAPRRGTCWAQVSLCFLVTICTAAAAPLKYQDIFGSEITTTVSAGAVDAAGNVYLTGWTTSPSLPVTPRAFQTTFIQSQCGTNYYPGPNGGPEVSVPIPCAHAFIAKIAADGASLVYLTYLGGEGYEFARAISVDGAGNVYVAGRTSSTIFPVTFFAYRSMPGSGFVTKLSAD